MSTDYTLDKKSLEMEAGSAVDRMSGPGKGGGIAGKAVSPEQGQPHSFLLQAT